MNIVGVDTQYMEGANESLLDERTSGAVVELAPISCTTRNETHESRIPKDYVVSNAAKSVYLFVLNGNVRYGA